MEDQRVTIACIAIIGVAVIAFYLLIVVAKKIKFQDSLDEEAENIDDN